MVERRMPGFENTGTRGEPNSNAHPLPAAPLNVASMGLRSGQWWDSAGGPRHQGPSEMPCGVCPASACQVLPAVGTFAGHPGIS